MNTKPIAKEDWEVLAGLFPTGWQELALETGALTRLRGFTTADALMRVLLLHIARGHSLRETAVLAKEAGIAEVSDVALLKRLRKAEGWLRELCRALLKEKGVTVPTIGKKKLNLRLIDATVVKEPGKTGSQWRIHFGISFPSLACDHFELTPVVGAGTGESFTRFPAMPGDLIVGDRGYSNPSGIEYLAKQQAFSLVRINTGGMSLVSSKGRPLDLLGRLNCLRKTGAVGHFEACVIGPSGELIPGRICAIRKSATAIELTHKKLRRSASKKGEKLQPQTLQYAQYVIAWTTVPEDILEASEVLTWYRLRWQVELVFKRFKSIADLGHLPKRDNVSARAWLYGKLFLALLTHKLIRHAEDFSPWGYM